MEAGASACTVIKAFLRRKCRTIYRKAGSSASQTVMNGQAHALLGSHGDLFQHLRLLHLRYSDYNHLVRYSPINILTSVSISTILDDTLRTVRYLKIKNLVHPN